MKNVNFTSCSAAKSSVCCQTGRLLLPSNAMWMIWPDRRERLTSIAGDTDLTGETGGGAGSYSSSQAASAKQIAMVEIFLMNCNKTSRPDLQPFARIERGCDRTIVEIVQLSADRYALRQRGQSHAIFNLIGDVMGGCLAVDCRIERQNDFGDIF